MKSKIVLLFCLALSGCSSITYEEGDAKFTRITVGQKQSAGPIIVHITETERHFEMGSLTTDQTEGLESVVKGAVSAVLKP